MGRESTVSPGTKIKLKRRRTLWKGCPEMVIGKVIFSNKYFFTVRTRGGYCESFNHVDLITGEVEVV